MTEKETLRIVLTEDRALELEFECSLETFITVIVAAVKEVALSNDKAAKLFVEIAQRYFRLNKGEIEMNTVPSYNYSTGKSKDVDIRHDEEIDALEQRCTALENRCTQLESRCTALESLTATHTQQISSLESRVSALEG